MLQRWFGPMGIAARARLVPTRLRACVPAQLQPLAFEHDQRGSDPSFGRLIAASRLRMRRAGLLLAILQSDDL
jgi:hypothetical protein